MNQVEFAYRVRQALNEGADRVPYRVAMRLEQARRTALARRKAAADKPSWVPAARFASERGATAVLDAPGSGWVWLRRLALVVPMMAALAVGFVSIYSWRQEQLIAERANIDLAVLLDDTPIDTYADKGFGVMIRDEQGI
ncbi:MAG TPA: DUF3619 family protein [Burkholderiaceae bacterium]|jgi:hypothetical protein|nr:DUF3619 family protein [Burkholderiaceae bacterium]